MTTPSFFNQTSNSNAATPAKVTTTVDITKHSDVCLETLFPAYHLDQWCTLIETKSFFGLIRNVTRYDYPNTTPSEAWQEYCGPSADFFLWFAIEYGADKNEDGSSKGLLINNQLIRWDNMSGGFYNQRGDDYEP